MGFADVVALCGVYAIVGLEFCRCGLLGFTSGAMYMEWGRARLGTVHYSRFHGIATYTESYFFERREE